jgi:syringate O-demethylase
MADRSLEDLLGTVESPVELLRNSQAGPNVYPGVPAEYTNWRDEQIAWQTTCVLFNQSYHMADLAVSGPDAASLLSRLAVNSFDGFTVDKAKHFVPCSPEGYVIGDVILFHLAEEEFNLVGRAPALNWITYHAETGGYDVEVELDQRWACAPTVGAARTGSRCRAERDAGDREGARRAAPELKFFNMTTVTIAGQAGARAAHGMVGQPGWELFGPWEDEAPVHEALLEAGEEFGLRQVGGRAYSSNTLESGWIPSPLPAVYSGESLSAYREWLPAAGYEGSASIGGSFYSPSIVDYYLTPWDLGYGGYVRFDHDFIGREALEAISDHEHRQKVTLALDDEDVTSTIGTMFGRRRSARSSWTGRRPCTACTRSTVSRSTARRPASRRGSAIAPTRARCSPWPLWSPSTPSPEPRSRSCGVRRTAARPSRPSSRMYRRRSARP